MLSSFDVEQIVKRILGTAQAPVAALKDGVIQSDGHRVLNFIGAGATVTDNPANRRVDIYLPGSVVGGGSTSSFYSSTAAKALSLWNGSSNNTPPTNWQTAGFSDAGWSAAVAANTSGPPTQSPPGGAASIWSTANPVSNTEQCLFRQTFSVPSGSVSAATLILAVDDSITAVYLNGTSLGISGSAMGGNGGQPFSVSTALLTPGSTNLLAIWANNLAASHAWVGYRLDSTNPSVVSGTANGTLGSLVACTTAGTYYDGPSVSLTAGTWFVTATVTTFNNTGGGTIATVKLWDGTNLYASTEMFEATSNQDYTHTLSALITLSTTTTVKASVAYNNNNGRIAASTANGGTPGSATQINALKVA